MGLFFLNPNVLKDIHCTALKINSSTQPLKCSLIPLSKMCIKTMMSVYPFTEVEQESTGLQRSEVESSFEVVEGWDLCSGSQISLSTEKGFTGHLSQHKHASLSSPNTFHSPLSVHFSEPPMGLSIDSLETVDLERPIICSQLRGKVCEAEWAIYSSSIFSISRAFSLTATAWEVL